jgi:hypothetical protein
MKKREAQYNQNKMFKEEAKKFYRNVNMENIEVYGRSTELLEVTMGSKNTA